MRSAASLPLLAGVALWSACTTSQDPSRATGTIELTQSDVAATVPAQVVRVAVEEGAWVRQGDTLVLLTQSTLPGDIAQRRARLAAAEAELRDLLAGARQPELDRARAELASAESEAERTARLLLASRPTFLVGLTLCLSLLLAERGRSAEAALLFGHGCRVFEINALPLEPAEHKVSVRARQLLRDALGDDELERLAAKGATLDERSAIALSGLA